MRLPQSECGKDLAALGFIALVLLVLLWPVTFGGKLLLPADMLMVMQPWQAHAQELGFKRVQTPFLDPIQQAYPWRKFAAEQMRHNTIPLWNPYTNCGMPFVANNQSACFYPETWLFMLMPPEHAFGWSALLSLLMGGGFMFAFLRALSLRRSSAVVGVLPFLLCGFMVGWMLLPTVRAVPMWLPLMLLCVERIGAGRFIAPGGKTGAMNRTTTTRGRATTWAAVLALATGMQFLAGHLHASLFVLLIVAAYAAFRLVQQALAGHRRAAAGALGLVASGVAVGTGLAMLQLLPVLELAGMGPRAGGQSFADIRGGGMVPLYLLTAVMPDLFGNPADYNFWGSALSPTAREWVETAWYTGVVALLLGIVAVVWRKAAGVATSRVWFWLGLWLGGVGLAWGTGLYYLLYLALPPLRQLPGVSRAVFICCFAGAVLAAYGFEALSRRLDEQAAAAVRRVCDLTMFALGLLALVGGVGVWLYTGAVEAALPGVGTYTLLQLARCLGLLALAALAIAVMTWTVQGRVPPRRVVWGKALLIGLLAADLLFFAHHFLPAVPAKYLHVRSAALETMRQDTSLYRMNSLRGEDKHGIDRMPPNLPMAFGFQDLQGSDSLIFKGYTDLWNTIPKDTAGNPMADSPLLDMLNCKYLLTSVDLAKTPGWRKVNSDEVGVWENTQVLPRTFVAGTVAALTPAQALEKMRGEFDPAAVTYLSGGTASAPPGAAPITARIADYQANAVTVQGSIPAGRLLVLGDTWYPGWRAYADGEATPIHRANYILRGVTPEKTATQVRFVYFPAAFAVGAFVTCLCVMLIACGLVVGRRRP